MVYVYVLRVPEGPVTPNRAIDPKGAVLALAQGDLTTCPDFDQRGVTRPQRSGCDIGAFELE